MKLKGLNIGELRAGEVVVYRGALSVANAADSVTSGAVFLKLAITVTVNQDEITLTPFTALWDDDDETIPAGAGPARIPKSVACSELASALAKPVLEVGDILIHRTRPARITETREGDLHVSIAYEDDKAGHFYGNLIWMDLSPSLDLLRDRASWPTHT